MVAVARRPDLRLREIAQAVGISMRATHSILNDLVEVGFLERRREGRRNRYQVRGDRALPDEGSADHPVSDLLGALVAGPRAPLRSLGSRSALVLACSDHRFQESLRDLMASQGLLSRAEIVLWPGGSAALTGAEGRVLLDVMALALGEEPLMRVVLVAHQDCHAWTSYERATGGLVDRLQTVHARRRRSIELIVEALGVHPETWYLTNRGAVQVGAAGSREVKIPGRADSHPA